MGSIRNYLLFSNLAHDSDIQVAEEEAKQIVV